MTSHLVVDDVNEADDIFISHAYFDHLPAADRIAIRTSAIVIANCEAINCLRDAGVPHEQLFPVQGDERIPPYRIDTTAATVAAEKNGKSKVLDLKHEGVVQLGFQVTE